MADDVAMPPLPDGFVLQGSTPPLPDGFVMQGSAPTPPDTSGVLKMAQDNLIANDNKSIADSPIPPPPQTPMDRLETASGLPVQKILNGVAQPSDINADHRDAYVKAKNNGSADNGADWTQSTLHAVSPIAAGIPTNHQAIIQGMMNDAAKNADSVLGKVADIAKQSLSNIGKAESDPLDKSGFLSATGDVGSRVMDIIGNMVRVATSPLEAEIKVNAASPDGALVKELAPLIAKIQFAGTDTPQDQIEAVGNDPKLRQTLSDTISQSISQAAAAGIGGKEVADTDNIFVPGRRSPYVPPEGDVSEAQYENVGEQKQLPSPQKQLPAPGVWDDHPGSDIFQTAIAGKDGDANTVTSSDIDQRIAEGSKNLYPDAKDFKNVATVITNGDTTIEPSIEKTLDVIYKETRKTPSDVMKDSESDPTIISEIKSGKTPAAYDSLIDLAKLPSSQLQIKHDEGTRSWAIVDKDGDYIKSGFESQKDAQYHIEERRFQDEDQAHIESEENETSAATVAPPELDVAGKQGEQLSAANDGRLKPTTAQKAPSEGLFDVTSRGQGDIFERKPEKEVGESETNKKIEEYYRDKYKEISPSKYRPTTHGSSVIMSDGAVLTADGALIHEDMARPAYEHAGLGDVAKNEQSYDMLKRTGAIRISGVNDPRVPLVFDSRNGFNKEQISAIRAVVKNNKERTLEFWDDGVSAGSTLNELNNYVNAGKPKAKTIIPPTEFGPTTNLRTFLSQDSQNQGAKFNEANELLSIKKDGQRITGEEALEHAHALAKEYGYFPKDAEGKPSSGAKELQDILTEKNGGRDATRLQDEDRVAKMQEAADAKKWKDPAFIENQARVLPDYDTDIIKGESEKDRTKRLIKEIVKFYANQQGSAPIGLIRESIGNTIVAAEKFTGKLTGGLFEKLGESYIKTFQPELTGPIGKRADAFLAKNKASEQAAVHAVYTLFKNDIRRWDKASSDQRLQYIYDHETGRWNEITDPEHAMHQALLDATFRAEKEAIGTDAEKGYRDNYLPAQFDDPEGVKRYFSSEAMIKKYGADWFTKPRTFDMIQDAVRAGFKLRTDNPARMVVSRLLAGQSMIRTMDLLNDMRGSGVAVPTRAFGIDKRIAIVEKSIQEVYKKYNEIFAKLNPIKQTELEGISGQKISKRMQLYEKRIQELKETLSDLNLEKSANKLSNVQMAVMKNGMRIVGPDSKAWNIHPQAVPVWKNAMELKGIYDREGGLGDTYRAYSQMKNIYTDVKLSLSLFHPTHEVLINVAGGLVAPIHHLIQGGKFSDLAWKDATNILPFGDSRGIDAYNTPDSERTPEQKADFQRMIEGGFVPVMSARDMVHFRDNWDKAIAGVGLNNLRLIGTALQLPGKVFEPLFSKWIPRLRSQMYFSLTDKALLRDPSLANNAGKRAEVFRGISQDIDRGYGQLNQGTLFWNPIVRDSFNSAYISGGWKLAQIYNVRGLVQPANIAYTFAKTGKFSKESLTYNMLQAYAYTAVTLAFGAIINKILGNPIGKAWDEAGGMKDYVWSIIRDCQFPQIGTNKDKTPIRVSQPSFIKEWFMAARDIDEQGLLGGAGKFAYEGTLIPSIKGMIGTMGDGLSDAVTLTPNPIGKDTLGRTIIKNPLDYHQWLNAGWDGINPITLSSYERAEEKGTTTGEYLGLAGLPLAGAHIDQSPFEHKLLAVYHDQNPSKDDAYTAKLKAEMRGAVTNRDSNAQKDIGDRMKDEGMTNAQIAFSKEPFKTTYSQFAWGKLSRVDQTRLIESASPEEKQKFKLKQ